MNSWSIVERLKEHLTDYSAKGAGTVAAALNAATRIQFTDARALAEFHEVVLFLRAYPANRDIVRLTEAILRGFAVRAGAVTGTDLEEPEISGIAGCGLTAVFTESTAAYLSRRYPRQVRIAWEAWTTQQRLGLVLPASIPLLADDAEVEAHPPYRRWLESVSGGGRRELAWLARHSNGRFDLLEVPLRWDFGSARAARSAMRLRGAPVFFHASRLISRREVDLTGITTSSPLPARRLKRAEGQQMLDLARETLAVRYRELHGYLWGDPSSVVEVEAGRGVRFYFSNVVPGHRLPLRSYLGATLWKNGVPIGYFEGLSIFERMEAGFNLFYTFRDGETAWIYRQLLTACHQLAGVGCFVLDPYQLGYENEEGIESGAWWFYRKLGYRSVDAALRRLTAREESRLASGPEYRTPAAALRRLASRPMVFETPEAEAGGWDGFETRRLGLAAARLAARRFEGDTAKMAEECARRVERVAGFSTRSWSELERRVLAGMAPLLTLIPDLPEWNGDEFRLLEKIIRSKAGRDENRHLRLTQRHGKLRAGLLRIGSAGVE